MLINNTLRSANEIHMQTFGELHGWLHLSDVITCFKSLDRWEEKKTSLVPVEDTVAACGSIFTDPVLFKCIDISTQLYLMIHLSWASGNTLFCIIIWRSSLNFYKVWKQKIRWNEQWKGQRSLGLITLCLFLVCFLSALPRRSLSQHSIASTKLTSHWYIVIWWSD